MAKERWFTGFEDANHYDCSAFVNTICATDALWPARSGDFYACQYNPNNLLAPQVRRDLVNSYTCTNNGDTVVARMQFAWRMRQRPASGLCGLGGFSLGTTVAPNQLCGINMQSTGILQVATTVGNVAGSRVYPVATSANSWYIARLHFQYTRNDAGNDPLQAILQIYDGATIDTRTPVLLETIQLFPSSNLGGFLLNGIPCLGSNVNGQIRIMDYDDWWFSVGSGVDGSVAVNPDLNWPTGSRIQGVPITGQVGGSNWTGSYLLARDIPNSAVAGNEQTTVTAGQTSTFTHQTAAQLGLIPVGTVAPGSGAVSLTPFNGAAIPDGMTTGAGAYFGNVQDLTLPIPTLLSYFLQAGAGSYTSGVWIRPFTIEWRSHATGMVAYAGPFGPSTFLSATAAPNFMATIQVRFNASTPQDRFLNPASPGTSAYRRYGLGLLVTNAYNDRGLLNPCTDQLNLSGTQTNSTNLSTYGGPGAIDAGVYGSLVALFSAVTPNGTGPPYAFTNPAIRPDTVTFLLSSPKPSGTGASPTTTNLFGPIFRETASTVPVIPLPTVAAIKVTPAFQLLAGTANNDILIDGAATSVATSTTFGSGFQQFAIDWNGRTAVQWDALTFGVRAGAGLATTLRLGSIVAEVMTAGPCTSRSTGSGQYTQLCGIYTSNNSIQKIPLPFKPTILIIKRIGATAANGSFKAWWMGGTMSWTMGGSAAFESISIMLLEDDGFTVGPANSANGAAATYAYIAIKDGQEDTINDAYAVSGSYMRDTNSDPDQIVRFPMSLLFAATWTPDVVFVPGYNLLKTPDMVSPNSDRFNNTGLITTGITAVGDKQFTTGTLLSVGAAAQQPYMAVKFDTAGLLATLFQYGNFAGNNAIQVITTAFRGEIIWLDHPTAGYDGVWRSDTGNTGNNSNPWLGGAVTTTNITAIGDTSFTVGTAASVTGSISYWLAWKRDGSIGNSGGSDIPAPSDGGGGTTPDDGGTSSDDVCGGGGMHLPPGTTGGAGCTAC